MVEISGGDGLAKALTRIAADLNKAGSVEVGFINRATYPGGTSVAAVAAYNEFGTSSIPPRPFFRNAIRENSAKWPVNLMTALKNTDYDAQASLGLVGQEISEEVQASIRSNTPPPLADATVKAKGFDTTLIDTGTLLKNVTYNVK